MKTFSGDAMIVSTLRTMKEICSNTKEFTLGINLFSVKSVGETLHAGHNEVDMNADQPRDQNPRLTKSYVASLVLTNVATARET